MNIEKMRKQSARKIPDVWSTTFDRNTYDPDEQIDDTLRFSKAMHIKHGKKVKDIIIYLDQNISNNTVTVTREVTF